MWIILLLVLTLSRDDYLQPYYYPIFCFWIGACSYALFSSLAHLLSSKSFMVRTTCYILDYHGIAMYSLGGCIAAFFYLNPSWPSCFAHKTLYLSVAVGAAISATLFCGLTRFFWEKYRYLIRILAFIFPYMCSCGPFLLRCTVCLVFGEDCVPETLMWHLLAIFLTGLLTFFFISKIPERFYPGQFDVFFQSHQLFHVSAAAMTTVQMYYVPLEADLRRAVMSSVDGANPTWMTTFLPLLCGEVGGMMVVVILSYLTWIGLLTTNKRDHSKVQ